MNSPKVSISVPVYNAERYLRQCLDCLVAQTLSDIEIVVVNDGSTDGTKEICEEFAKKDSRIKLIHKENGGIASGRQVALATATGQFMASVDADDWVEPNFCEKMFYKAVAENADVVLCDSWYEYEHGGQRENSYGKDVPANNDEIIEEALIGRMPCAVWNKLYKIEFLREHKISFEEGVNMGEDVLFFLKALRHPIRLVYLPECLYHYRRMPGEDSYTNRVTLSSYDQMLRIQDWIESNFDSYRYSKGINHYLINIAFAGLRVEEGMTFAYYKKTSVKRLGFADLFFEHSLKSMVILWTKVFGYNAGRSLYQLMYKRVYK